MPLRANSPTISGWTAEDSGLVGWAFDPATASQSTILTTGGTLYCVKIKAARAVTVTNILLAVSVAGVTLTAGQCFAGLYSPAGVLLSATADQSTAWLSSGIKTMALTAPQAVAAGVYTVAFYAVGSTLPSLRTGVVSGIPASAGMSTAASRFGVADTGLTTALPGTLAALSASSFAWWAALS